MAYRSFRPRLHDRWDTGFIAFTLCFYVLAFQALFILVYHKTGHIYPVLLGVGLSAVFIQEYGVKPHKVKAWGECNEPQV